MPPPGGGYQPPITPRRADIGFGVPPSVFAGMLANGQASTDSVAASRPGGRPGFGRRHSVVSFGAAPPTADFWAHQSNHHRRRETTTPVGGHFYGEVRSRPEERGRAITRQAGARKNPESAKASERKVAPEYFRAWLRGSAGATPRGFPDREAHPGDTRGPSCFFDIFGGANPPAPS
ncbi:MAG: hypothetical protein MMC23_010001, partial [Stictis urceolatum]|nr:hypothetical protein [Stictis urceolata]